MSPQQQSTAERAFEPVDGAPSGYSQRRPELELPEDRPPAERQAGPSGLGVVSATVGMFAFVGAIFVLLGIGGTSATGAAIAVMVLGVVVVSRYVERISWTRSSPTQLRRGPAGTKEGLSASDEAHDELSPYDFPRENPARQQLEREAA